MELVQYLMRGAALHAQTDGASGSSAGLLLGCLLVALQTLAAFYAAEFLGQGPAMAARKNR